jgi:uncharacterized protein YbbC (DUF1343 family)
MVLLLISLFFMVLVQAQIRTGAEQTELYYSLLKDKRIGVVANQASMVHKISIVKSLVSQGFQVKVIFSPEHISGEAGEERKDQTEQGTGIRVLSLYGERKKPTGADLSGLDVILFDIQDVGVRFYTYISTLTLVMEACAEHDVPLVVLDRPNPNGFYIDGPVLERSQQSFVGMHPVPVVYGMTIGEYALIVNGEGWLECGKRCGLRVIPMAGYTHSARCSLPDRPSPNLPDLTSILLYPSLCLFEGTPFSVGRGTAFPFQVYGHPSLDWGTFVFTPGSIPGQALHPPLEGILCRGEDLRGYFADHPGDSGKIILGWLIKAYKSWNGNGDFFTPYFDKLAGNETLKEQIIRGVPEEKIRENWKPGIDKFRKIREKYLIYK